MRGFRGSRSVQNSLASRFGDRRDQRLRHGSGVGGGAGSFDRFGSSASRAPLPDWLKTPETREAEQRALGQAQRPAKAPPVRLVVDHIAVRAEAPRPKLASARKRSKPAAAARGGAARSKSVPARTTRRKAA
jgi:hypothetical protein